MVYEQAAQVANGAFVDHTRMVVPSEFVAHVIGRQGATIRDIQEQSKIPKIDIQTEEDMRLNMAVGVYGRTLNFLGDMNSRYTAIYIVYRMVRRSMIPH
jgi:hypothetical protein